MATITRRIKRTARKHEQITNYNNHEPVFLDRETRGRYHDHALMSLIGGYHDEVLTPRDASQVSKGNYRVLRFETLEQR